MMFDQMTTQRCSLRAINLLTTIQRRQRCRQLNFAEKLVTSSTPTKEEEEEDEGEEERQLQSFVVVGNDKDRVLSLSNLSTSNRISLPICQIILFITSTLFVVFVSQNTIHAINTNTNTPTLSSTSLANLKAPHKSTHTPRFGFGTGFGSGSGSLQGPANLKRMDQIQGQMLALRRQLELELIRGQMENGTQMALGSPCLSSNECSKWIRNGHCQLETLTCTCLPQHIELNSTTCLAPALLGFECQLDAQCRQRVPNSVCRLDIGRCSCPEDKFVAYRRDKCLPASKLNDYCLGDAQCRLYDKHSLCKWKIPNIYGICKCPPNYKSISVATANDNGNGTTILASNESGAAISQHCAPRLGDTCLSNEECQWLTENSLCRQQDDLFDAHKLSRIKWNTSVAILKGSESLRPRRCFCKKGFIESANWMLCERQVDTTTTISSASLADAKHHYELVIATGDAPSKAVAGTNSNSGTTTTGFKQQQHQEEVLAATSGLEQLDIKLLLQKKPAASHQAAGETTMTTIETSNNKDNNNNNNNNNNNSTKTTTAFRMSSLGKSCKQSLECQMRDINSDCIDGICECIKPTARCSSRSNGCHLDTFQCRNGQCISWYFVCDKFKNCDDGSDEDDCQLDRCPPEAFQCSDGACLTRGKLCDGQIDCSDASDESLCGSPPALKSDSNSNNNNNSFTSIDGQAKNLSQHQQLRPLMSSTQIQTITGNGSSKCHSKAFTCANGQCLPAYVFCNSVEDCADGSDEWEHICERRPLRPSSSLVALETTTRKPVSSSTNTPTTRAPPAAEPKLSRLTAQSSQRPSIQVDSPLVRVANRATIERLMATLNLAQRTPDNRGHRAGTQARKSRLLAAQPASAIIPLECPKEAFTCKNGKCRSSAILCSGVDGCGDNSDENRCEVCQCAAP